MQQTDPSLLSAPVLGVSALVVAHGRVLLVKRGKAPFSGYWGLPGGRVQLGERLEEAVRREVLEETSIVIGAPRQIDVVEILLPDTGSADSGHFVLVVFRGDYLFGAIAAGDDAAEARWFDPPELGDLLLTEQSRVVIERFASVDENA